MSECEHTWGFVVSYWRGADKVFVVCKNPKCKMVLTKGMAEAMLNEHAALKRLVDEYKPHVDGAWEQVKLKTQRIDELEAENAALSELLSGLVDVEAERDKYKAALRTTTCLACGRNMLECECDD